MKIRITKIRPAAVIPAYATQGAAAFDLTAAETTIIPPHSHGLVSTGLVFSLPQNHVMHIFARSSTFAKLGLMLANGVGVIDSDYCGPNDEVRVITYNPGDAPVTIEAGMRVAQAMVYPYPRIEFEEGPTQELSRGGLGSTGGYASISDSDAAASKTDVKPKLRQPAEPAARRVYWMNRMNVEREDGEHLALSPTPEQLAVAIAKCSRSSTPFDQNVDDVTLEKAADFHEKWVVGFGHGSVAEHAVASVAIQNIPQVVIKILEDTRLASYTEKSSRYVIFTRERVAVPDTLSQSRRSGRVNELFDHLYGLYESLVPEVTTLMQQRFPKKEEMSDAEYKAATKGRVCDVVRYLLPAAATASLGMTANARIWEHAIIKLLSSADPLARKIGQEIKDVLKGNELLDKDRALREKPLPTLLKYAEPHAYLTNVPSELAKLSKELVPDGKTSGEKASPDQPVVMLRDDLGAELHVAAALLARFGREPYSAALEKLTGDRAAVERVLRAALEMRGLHDAPLREFESAWFQHEIVMDYGSWRDVQRHRMCCQINQELGVDLGYDIPEPVYALGRENEFKKVLDEAAAVHAQLINDGLKIEAQYVVPMAYRRRLIVGWNLREIFHFVELRSSRKGHPSYRRIAQEVWKTVQKNHPLIASFIRVDFSTDTLSTLGEKPKGF